MPQPVPPPPLTIPAPPQVRVAAVLVILQGVALGVLAVLVLVSGIRHHADTAQLLAQVAYYLVLGLAVVAVAVALLRGRRWGRTPAVVIQVVAAAVGVWLIAPSGQLGWGLAVLGVAAIAGGLLVTRPASAWIARFPRPFGPGPDR